MVRGERHGENLRWRTCLRGVADVRTCLRGVAAGAAIVAIVGVFAAGGERVVGSTRERRDPGGAGESRASYVRLE
eukprot:3228047-Pyramimonas_sp.AAC.1